MGSVERGFPEDDDVVWEELGLSDWVVLKLEESGISDWVVLKLEELGLGLEVKL